MKKYVDLDAVLDVLAKDHAKRTDDQEAEILKVWDEIRRIPKANVVELPCEIGQKVYCVRRGKLVEAKIFAITIQKENLYLHMKKGASLLVGVMNKDVFLSKEEAEFQIKKEIKK